MAALWVLFRTRMVIFRTRMVCIRTRTIQDRFSRAALLGHLSSSNGLRSNSNHPEQVSKGRPRHTSYETFGNGRPLASSFELEWFAFELEWSAFKLEPSRTGFQGPPSSHTFYKSLTVVERFSLRLEEAAFWVIFRTRMFIFRTRTVQNRLPRAALVAHLL